MEHFEWYEEESVDTTGICTSLLVLHYNIYGTPLFNELMQTKEGGGENSSSSIYSFAWGVTPNVTECHRGKGCKKLAKKSQYLLALESREWNPESKPECMESGIQGVESRIQRPCGLTLSHRMN
jgi:hypothetical protein